MLDPVFLTEPFLLTPLKVWLVIAFTLLSDLNHKGDYLACT